MGWAGSSDAWYNLPTIDTDIGTFTSVYKCIYNLTITHTCAQGGWFGWNEKYLC